MKHLLNNLTEQEKNSIREQHTGGMRVSNNRFKALLENKLGNSKPLVEKFDDEDDYDFEDEELYSGAPERLVKHMDSGKIVGTHKHGVGYTPNKHGIRLGHSSHPTSIPNFTKFEDDYDFEDDTYSINEQVPVSGSTGPVPSSTSTPLSVSGSTTASTPARDKVVNDCVGYIYSAMYNAMSTFVAEAKKEKFTNSIIPTEEEWYLAQKKFLSETSGFNEPSAFELTTQKYRK